MDPPSYEELVTLMDLPMKELKHMFDQLEEALAEHLAEQTALGAPMGSTAQNMCSRFFETSRWIKDAQADGAKALLIMYLEGRMEELEEKANRIKYRLDEQKELIDRVSFVTEILGFLKGILENQRIG